MEGTGWQIAGPGSLARKDCFGREMVLKFSKLAQPPLPAPCSPPGCALSPAHPSSVCRGLGGPPRRAPLLPLSGMARRGTAKPPAAKSAHRNLQNPHPPENTNWAAALRQATRSRGGPHIGRQFGKGRPATRVRERDQRQRRVFPAKVFILIWECSSAARSHAKRPKPPGTGELPGMHGGHPPLSVLGCTHVLPPKSPPELALNPRAEGHPTRTFIPPTRPYSKPPAPSYPGRLCLSPRRRGCRSGDAFPHPKPGAAGCSGGFSTRLFS